MKQHKHRLPPFQHNGILLVDKPKEWTSHDIVNFIRMRFNVSKVGHCGTLDPAATGLLVVLLGHATKMTNSFSGQDKSYEGTILFGTQTDSQDMDGKITSQKDSSHLTEQLVKETFAKFAGEQNQIPPMVSAVKKDGKKLYELARQGKTVERKPKKITIHKIDVLKVYLPYTDFFLRCTKGTYLRTLCHDIGQLLDCGAVLFSLKRISSGNFFVKDASDPEQMKNWNQDDLYKHLLEF